MKKPFRIQRLAVFAIAALGLAVHGLSSQSPVPSTSSSPSSAPSLRAFSADSGIVRITQRYDLRRYLGSQYKGIFYGYSLGTWNVGYPGINGSRPVKARYFFGGESNTDLTISEKRIDDQLESSFSLMPDGSVFGLKGGLVPYQRGFPNPPPAGTQTGQKWVAPLELVLPGNSFAGLKPAAQQATTLKLLAEYTLKGNAVWLGNPVVEVSAKYAVRYRNRQDPSGDPNLQNVEGTRDATIYLDPGTFSPVYVRERVTNETYTYADGATIRNEGFILTFYEGSLPMDRGNDGTLIAGLLGGTTGKPAGPDNRLPGNGNTDSGSPGSQINSSAQPSPGIAASPQPRASAAPQPTSVPQQTPAPTLAPQQTPMPGATPTPLPNPSPGTLIAAGTGGPRTIDNLDLEDGPVHLQDMTIADDPRGISISLENLRFEADKAVLLPGDEPRLDRIATVLKTFPARNILVIGHTAQVGSVESQQTLSLERARVIVEALKKRGIEARRLLFEGRGGSEPIAGNDTETGRAQNRRVQVIILD